MVPRNSDFQARRRDLLKPMDLLLLKYLVRLVKAHHELVSRSLRIAQILIYPFLLVLLLLLLLVFFSFLLLLCILVNLYFSSFLCYYLSLPLMINLVSFFHHLFLKLLLLLLNFQNLHLGFSLYLILLLLVEQLRSFCFFLDHSNFLRRLQGKLPFNFRFYHYLCCHY